ncbi:MAG: LysM peptidoglycan-binding domain-containing protein [Bacteroidota bacterium]
MLNLKQLFSLIILTCLWGGALHATHLSEIPDTIRYCGMELYPSQGAKKILAETVEKITASPRYFNQMVVRSQKYFPFIEAAFQKHRVPMDLKYLAIQESSLRPNAVSSSNAVGFWQFKAPTAREVGLKVNEEIDERRHIYRASEGAAIYLSQANFDFSNWVYAVIAYYEGPTGAVSHTQPNNYARNSMSIDEDLHWYVMKAIAHKLAYAPAVEKAKPIASVMEMIPSRGQSKVKKIIKKYGMKSEEFSAFNPWLLTNGSLPGKGNYYLFVKPTEEPRPSPTEPVAELPDNTSREESTFPKAASRAVLQPSQYASFDIKYDLQYGIEFVLFEGDSPLGTVAMNNNTMLQDLREWNGLGMSNDPAPSTILYLKKPKRCYYHIVSPGEDLLSISDMHKTSPRKIQKLNRMNKENLQIYTGQKLYMKKKKPKGELMIILVNDKDEPTPVVDTEKPNPDGNDKPTTPPVTETPTGNKIWIDHEVKAGESLWSISQLYNTKVEIIKMINKLPNDNIQVGQNLKILAAKDDVKNGGK